MDDKPCLRDIIDEADTDLKEIPGILGAVILGPVVGVGIFAYSFAYTLGSCFLVPYILPTMLRRVVEKEDNSLISTRNCAYDAGIFAGGLCGFFYGIIAQSGAYIGTAFQGNPDVLMIPLITNIISGVYELGLRAEKRLIDKKTKKCLENIVDKKYLE